MGTISTTLPSDGQTIDASDVNTPINAILSEFNGNIDNDNIKTAANISGSKLADTSITGAKVDSTFRGGWIASALPAVSSVTANGNRSYTVTFASTVASILTPGMRVRATRTVAAPTKCTDLESGSSQYYNKTTPNKLTFTDDFVCSAWVKLESYADTMIISRYNGTSGWLFRINSTGQVNLVGFNAGASNFSQVASYQSIPLGKWVHVTAQLDMSAFTATTTTSYVMIDGVDVPVSVSRGGTNPTALVQAGDLQVGAANTSSYFDGKLAQVAVYSAKVTQATILASIDRTLTGSETSLASAYSFNNSITDLNTTTPNDLTAQGSAVATNADSPFSQDSTGTIGSYDYGIVTKVATTVATVQVPEGCALPTTGGITTVDMSPWKVPFGFPADVGRWRVISQLRTSNSTTSNATYGAFISAGYALNVPIGAWIVGHRGCFLNSTTTTVYFNISPTALTGLTAAQGNAIAPYTVTTKSAGAAAYTITAAVQQPQNLSAATSYVMYTLGATTSASIDADATNEIFAELAYL